MKNMDNGLTVSKCVLINLPKIPQIPQYLSAQIVRPSSKVWDFDKEDFIERPQTVGSIFTTEAERVIPHKKKNMNDMIRKSRNEFWDKYKLIIMRSL